MKKSDSKELVSLRSRAMKNGGESLYLDYMVDGIRQREFLKMYIVPERSGADRVQNEATRQMAQAVRAKRTLELQGGAYSLSLRPKQSGRMLRAYIAGIEAEFRAAGHKSYADTLGKIRNWLAKYGKDIPLGRVDRDYLVGFKLYMADKLAASTVFVLFSNLGSILNRAYREDLIPYNPMSKLEPAQKAQKPESTRDFLTLDEVRKLAATDYPFPDIKSAFLFACFTGLRMSDIIKLDWSMIGDTAEGGLQVQERQTKTGKIVYVPLSANALAWLPERRMEGKVWLLPSQQEISRHIREWTKGAGMTKRVTFHVARHTYATLLLTYGTDIYTVSSLLGHRSVVTTQIYAKIVDDKKRKAVDSIPAL